MDNELHSLLNAQGQMDNITKDVITRAIPKKDIKERSAGYNKKLSYVSGATVINLLNEAFNYRWSFVIKDVQTVASIPRRNKDGTLEEQSPYVQVLGQLILPDLGIVKEQYGTKILLGGASEQEGAAKAAATDALKKCATLVGIALELYETDEVDAAAPATQPNRPPAARTGSTAPQVNWDQEDVNKLKEYKALLGVTDNAQLDPYVREFLNDGSATWKNVSPTNVKAFNVFLKKKVEQA